MNAPPNGPILLWQGVTDSTNETTPQRLPPKNVRPTGKKANHRNPSFGRKVNLVPATTRTSRGCRLAHRSGSTVALEYLSQGHLVRG